MELSPDQKLDVVLSRLEAVKRTAGGFMARCPAHQDRSPSLSVSKGENLVLLHCWAGCDVNSVRTALDLEWGDLYYESRQRDENGFVPKPTRKKSFTQEKRRAMALEAGASAMRLQGDHETLKRLRKTRGWARGALAQLGVGWTGERLTMLSKDKDGNPHDILLYDPFPRRSGRKMLAGEGRSRQPWPPPEEVKAETKPLYIVEGEGTAISLASLGLPCVGLPGSISKPTYDFSNPGRWRGVGWHYKWVMRFTHSEFVLLPDCDEVGRQLMLAVDYDLGRAGSKVTYCDLSPENTSGFDIGDWLRPATTLERRQHARFLLELFVKTMKNTPLRGDEVRDSMREWYKEANATEAVTT